MVEFIPQKLASKQANKQNKTKQKQTLRKPDLQCLQNLLTVTLATGESQLCGLWDPAHSHFLLQQV